MNDYRHTLVVLRHGQSEWNSQNRFTGWVDVGLTPTGVEHARGVGAQLRGAGLRFDLAVTSVLKRAVGTLAHLQQTLQQPYLPVVQTWRLNDRHYGALTGLEKDQAAQIYGADAVRRWRRGFGDAPPPMPADAQRRLVAAIADVMPPADQLPDTESLRDTQARVLHVWNGCIGPALQAGRTVLLVGHGNSLRALLKHLYRIDDDAVTTLEVEHAQAAVLRFDDRLRLQSHRPLAD